MSRSSPSRSIRPGAAAGRAANPPYRAPSRRFQHRRCWVRAPALGRGRFSSPAARRYAPACRDRWWWGLGAFYDRAHCVGRYARGAHPVPDPPHRKAGVARSLSRSPERGAGARRAMDRRFGSRRAGRAFCAIYRPPDPPRGRGPDNTSRAGDTLYRRHDPVPRRRGLSNSVVGEPNGCIALLS